MTWDSHILSRSEIYWHGRLASKECFEITKIHPGSLAEAAGLRPGMYTLFIEDGLSVTEWDQLKSRGIREPIKTRFFDRERRECVLLETLGFPWGMRLEQPHDQFCAQVRRGFSDDGELAQRVLDADDAAYGQLVAAARLAVVWPTLLKRGVRLYVKFKARNSWQEKARAGEMDDPLRTAAALGALARKDIPAAKGLLPEPSKNLMNDRGTAVAALYHYASAHLAEATGKPRNAVIEHLLHANDQRPKSNRVHKALAELGVAATTPTSNVMRHFPIDYVLPIADPLTEMPGPDSRYIRLGDILATLQANQIAAIIVLGGYRTNGPYHHLAENLGHLYPVIALRLPLVHVLTSEIELRDRTFTDYWRGGERAAIGRGVPLTVLTDAEDVVGDALGITKSPTMCLLSRDGRVLYEGSDDDDGPFWEAFAALETGTA